MNILIKAALVPEILAFGLVAFTSAPAPAQEVRIGHLETQDDIALNWVYFHCNQLGETLSCDSFQTLMPAPCKVLNDYVHTDFKWNASSQTWVSRNGPSGVCGIASVETLEKDKTSLGKFWVYTLKRTTTNPAGRAPNGMSCAHCLPTRPCAIRGARPRCGSTANLLRI